MAEYDYSTPGAYFVTKCTYKNLPLFGRVESGNMIQNDVGKMIDIWWCKLPDKYPHTQLDSYIIMPNHLHGIIIVLEHNKTSEHVGADPCVRPAVALPEILKWFKTMTTNDYMRGVKQRKWPQFDKHLWQRSYYEHVIRKLDDIYAVREYICNNPLRWELKRKAN